MEPTPLHPSLTRKLGLKVGSLLVMVAIFTCGFFIYVLYTHGVFEQSRILILTTRDAESIAIGMPLSFSGLPIGKVTDIRLTEKGKVEIEISVPVRHERFLREGSEFISDRPLVGAAKIKVYTGNFDKPILPNGSTQPLISGDTAAKIPDLIAQIKQILTKIDTLFAENSSLTLSLSNIQTLTQRMIGEYGVLSALLGSREKAAAFADLVDRVNSVFLSLIKMSEKGEHLIENADVRLFGSGGILPLARESLAEIHGLLKEAGELLKKTDAVLSDAKSIGANLKDATVDIEILRKEIEKNLGKIEFLLDSLSNTWPFEQSSEVHLP